MCGVPHAWFSSMWTNKPRQRHRCDICLCIRMFTGKTVFEIGRLIRLPQDCEDPETNMEPHCSHSPVEALARPSSADFVSNQARSSAQKQQLYQNLLRSTEDP